MVDLHERDPAKTQALVDFCFDGRFDEVHAPVRALLFDECFDRCEGLTASENGHLAYARARFVGSRSVRPSQAADRIYELCALAEWPGLSDVSVFSILMVHYNLTVGTIVDRGRPGPQLERALAALDNFEAFGPYLATELGYGNNVAGLRTVATYLADENVFELHTPSPEAAKYMSYSGFTDIDKVAVVLARTVIGGRDVGVFPFLLDIVAKGAVTPGVERAACPEKPVQGLDNGITWFDGARVPRGAWLSRGLGEISADGDFVAELSNPHRRFLATMSRIVPGRLCVSSSALGAAKASLYLALTFSATREVNAPGGRRPIRDFQQYKDAMYPALARTYSLVAQLNELKARYERDPGDGALHTEISATKAVTTVAMQDVVDLCRERCGSQGIFSVNRIADYVSLLQGLVTAEGDSQVLLGTAAVQHLHASAGSDHIGDVPAESVRGVDPALAQLVRLLGRRSAALAARYHDHRETAPDSLGLFDRINSGLPLALDYGRAWVAQRAAESLLRQVGGTAHESARRALARVAELFALDELLADSTELLIAREVTAQDLSRWRSRRSELLGELDEDVDDLIDAFRIDAPLLRAPIANPDHIRAFVATCTGPGDRLLERSADLDHEPARARVEAAAS